MNAIYQKIKQKFLPKVLTLKFRLMLLITVVLLIVVGGPLYFLVYQLDKNYQEFSVDMIETTSQAVYQSVYEGFMQNDWESIQRNLELLSLEPNIEHLRIYRPSGEILYSSNPNEVNKNIFKLGDPVFQNPSDTAEQEAFKRVGNAYSHQHLIYVQKECLPCHANQGSIIGIMDVKVELSQSEYIYSSIKQLTIISAILIVVFLWIILNLLYEGQIEARLKKIIYGFNELARGNFNFKIKMPGRHELAMLSEKFNQTTEKLQEAKSREEQFMQENLQRADRLVTLGEVAAEIAHEVNNPAGIILTRAEYIRDELQQNNASNSQYVDDLNIIIQQTQRIAETTRSILHYARKLPRQFSQTDLNQVVRQSIKILEPRIRKRNVQVSFNPLSKPVLIEGNFHQLEQVFCNLINNSLDVVPVENGKIQIEIQSRSSNNHHTEYSVIYKDNGPGIPLEYSDEIFSPFFTTKGDEKGTGLGLFIVRNIITNHRGKIYLANGHNGEAVGATFIIELEASYEQN